MKLLIVFLTVIFMSVHPLFSQNKFKGIPFGKSFAEVKKILLSEGEKIGEILPNTITIYGGSFGGRECTITMLFFMDNKFYSGVVQFKPTDFEYIKYKQLYNDIKSDIIKKYGNPTNDSDVISSWYFDAQHKLLSSEEIAQQDSLSKAKLIQQGNFINVSYYIDKDKEVSIMLTIADMFLANENKKREELKNSKDF